MFQSFFCFLVFLTLPHIKLTQIIFELRKFLIFSMENLKGLIGFFCKNDFGLDFFRFLLNFKKKRAFCEDLLNFLKPLVLLIKLIFLLKIFNTKVENFFQLEQIQIFL